MAHSQEVLSPHIKADDNKFEQSPSKSDLIRRSDQSASHNILNLEQLEAIKHTVEKRISEKTSP